MTTVREDSLRRLRASASSVWLVQCNPRVTDVLANRTLPTTWCVRRHVADIRAGDSVVWWLSGPRSGVYALGEVTGAVRRPPFTARTGARPPAAEAPLDLFVDLRDRPVVRAELRHDTRFVGEPILRQPFAANPHRVSHDAFAAILERVDPAA